MSLPAEYRQQFGWRPWRGIFAALPGLPGQTVLDLGCGVGDQAAELVARGARVIGVDLNEELLMAARSRGLENAEFLSRDLRALPDLEIAADGIWCSFAAAYFPDLPAVLTVWARHLRPGGWIALTEIDDMFGHEPVCDRTRALLAAYVQEAFAAGRYDFRMGHKLAEHMEVAGFTVETTLSLRDRELSFNGPALPEVIEAWRIRLDRMRLLHDFCGKDFEAVRDDFLGCLARDDHRSAARVCCCIAAK